MSQRSLLHEPPDATAWNPQNAAMDQGIAGVVAGIAGLVGAGIGGLATAYGARVGAQKTIEAAQAQVSHQSAAEHTHWVREQRTQLCSELARRHASFAFELYKNGAGLTAGQQLSRDVREDLMARHLEIAEIAWTLQLWGPTGLSLATSTLSATGSRVLTSAISWSEAVRAEGDIPACAQSYQAARDADAAARSSFTREARKLLSLPD